MSRGGRLLPAATDVRPPIPSARIFFSSNALTENPLRLPAVRAAPASVSGYISFPGAFERSRAKHVASQTMRA